MSIHNIVCTLLMNFKLWAELTASKQACPLKNDEKEKLKIVKDMRWSEDAQQQGMELISSTCKNWTN